jgi:cytochrome P450/NADPH-cytochrome P450 reductase
MTDSALVKNVALVGAASSAVLVLGYLRSKRKVRADEIPQNTAFWKLPFFGHTFAFAGLSKKTERAEMSRFWNAAQVDGVCRLQNLRSEVILVGDPNLIQQMFTDTELFGKTNLGQNPVIVFVRKAVGNGLFTADDEDDMWGVAHRILTKPFSREGMMAFVPMMNAQADRLVELILRDVGIGGIGVFNELVTKMAFETISYCGMGTEFGSFDSTEVHPFVSDMNAVLKLTGEVLRSPLKFLPSVRKKVREFDAVCARVGAVVQEIIAKRKNKETTAPGQMPDLLDLMLYGIDAKTGSGLTDQNIGYQIITFLIAGHDTTASAMSFFLDFVTSDPRVESKLLREIESVVGNGDVKFEDLKRLKYLDMCQKETLRLQPPARGVQKVALQDGFLGKFRIYKGMRFLVPFMAVHRSTEVWGPDAEKFVPERWEKGAPHPFAYLPFSTGPRGCIGMEFSLVEQKVALVKLLQRFCLRQPKNAPELELESKLFVGPIHFKLQVFDRPDFDGAQKSGRRASVLDNQASAGSPTMVWQVSPTHTNHNTALRVLYGSNGGSTRELAQKTTLKAKELGFSVTLAPMDEFASAGVFEAGTCSLFLCATYNGQPPDQSVAFMEFLRDARGRHETPLRGSSFAVFGCGNTQWAGTYQAVPVALDEGLEALGGRRAVTRHEGDSAADLEQVFEQWLDVLWPSLASSHGLPLERVKATESQLPLPSVEVLTDGTAPVQMSLDFEGGAQLVNLAVNRELVGAGGDRSVRHLEFDLAPGDSYKAGDHLAVYPENDSELVAQLMRRLDLSEDVVVRLDFTPVFGSGDVRVVALKDWLRRAVDLSKGSGSSAIEYLGSRATLGLEQVTLAAIAKADHAQRMQMPLLELLLKFRSIEVTLPEVLALLPPMKPRLYSISSSPLALTNRVSISVGVLRGTTQSGREHLGVCSNFLAALPVGAKVWVNVRDTGSSFRLPPPPTPMILVGPGTGLAPLRGFLQELQQQRKSGISVGAVHLFFGCRTTADFLYEDELRAFEADGTLTKLHVAFSRMGDKRYVQHAIKEEAAALWPVLRDGHVFVCGDASRMAPDVRDALRLVALSGGMDERTSQNFLDELRSNSAAKRYHEDVWAGNA